MKHGIQSIVAFFLMALPPPSTWAHGARGTVTGQVKDVEGFPIEGVAVASGGVCTTTNPGGLFTLSGAPQDERVILELKKEGFATTYGSVSLAVDPAGDFDGDHHINSQDRCPSSNLSESVVIDGRDTGVENTVLKRGCTIMDRIARCAESGRRHKFLECVEDLTERLKERKVITKHERRAIVRAAREAELPLEEGGNPRAVPTSANLVKVMVPAGATQTVSAESGGTIQQDGFSVTFDPGDLDATGDVDIVVSPIDVSTSAIDGSPGEFEALEGSGERGHLETFGLMDVQLTQNGAPVELASGQTATLEFLLPRSATLQPGDEIPLWFFDAETGFWREEGTGTVFTSSFDASRLAVVGEVSHFSWWNVDQLFLNTMCIISRVFDPDAAEGRVSARVSATSGLGFFSYSSTSTDADGDYCIEVRGRSVVRLTATASKPQNPADGRSVIVSTSKVLDIRDIPDDPPRRCFDSPNRCLRGDLGLLNLPPVACISGDVRDEDGNALSDVVVRSTTGGFETSDGNGRFCFLAQGGATVTVFSPGFFPVSVATPNQERRCAQGPCAQTTLNKVPFTGLTCLSGQVFDGGGKPVQKARVEAKLPFPDDVVVATATADDTGTFCLANVPANRTVVVNVEGEDEFSGGTCFGGTSLNSGPSGGTCAAQNCTLAGTITCSGK